MVQVMELDTNDKPPPGRWLEGHKNLLIVTMLQNHENKTVEMVRLSDIISLLRWRPMFRSTAVYSCLGSVVCVLRIDLSNLINDCPFNFGFLILAIFKPSTAV